MPKIPGQEATKKDGLSHDRQPNSDRKHIQGQGRDKASTKSDRMKQEPWPNDLTVLQQVLGNRAVQRLSATGELKDMSGYLRIRCCDSVARRIDHDNKLRREASVEGDLRGQDLSVRRGQVNAIQRDDNGGGAGTGTRPRSVGAALAQASLNEIRSQATARSFTLGAYTEAWYTASPGKRGLENGAI